MWKANKLTQVRTQNIINQAITKFEAKTSSRIFKTLKENYQLYKLLIVVLVRMIKITQRNDIIISESFGKFGVV